jgi:hypothetical protein
LNYGPKKKTDDLLHLPGKQEGENMAPFEKLSKVLPYLTTTSGINILQAIERQVPEAQGQINVSITLGDQSPVFVSSQTGPTRQLLFRPAAVHMEYAPPAPSPEIENKLSKAEFDAMKQELDRLSALSRSKEWQARLSWALAWAVVFGASVFFLWGLFQLVRGGGTDAAVRTVAGVVGSYFSTVLLKLYNSAEEALNRIEERRKPLWEALLGKKGE